MYRAAALDTKQIKKEQIIVIDTVIPKKMQPFFNISINLCAKEAHSFSYIKYILLGLMSMLP